MKTFIILFTTAFMISFVYSECKSQEVMDLCVQKYTESINSQCRKGNQENYECFCSQLPALIGCYDNCPTDLNSLSRKGQVQKDKDAYCSYSKGFNGLNPTPTLVNNNFAAGMDPNNGLFAVSSSGSNVIIGAGPTSVVVPVKGNDVNTNTPVVGSLYSKYTLGSLSVGYNSATFSLRSSSISVSSSNIITHGFASILAITLALVVSL